ncbi:MAG: SPW repeat protein, partial [Rhizobium sp.]|nr:SPW repeat protein [Rhizobium sp.]
MAGAAIGVVAIFSIADLFDTVSIPAFFESEEWINLTIGSWLAICPWVLNFNDDTMAMQVHLVVGIVVAAIGAVELWVIHHRPAEKERDKLC